MQKVVDISAIIVLLFAGYLSLQPLYYRIFINEVSIGGVVFFTTIAGVISFATAYSNIKEIGKRKGRFAFLKLKWPMRLLLVFGLIFACVTLVTNGIGYWEFSFIVAMCATNL